MFHKLDPDPQLKNILEDADFSNRNHVATPAEYYESYTDRLLTTAFYTAYLKISEGCSNRCAFCIIPKMRGPMPVSYTHLTLPTIYSV